MTTRQECTLIQCPTRKTNRAFLCPDEVVPQNAKDSCLSSQGISLSKKEYLKIWRKKNPTYHKKWVENHPDYFFQWRTKNPDYHKQHNKLWRAHHPKKIKEYKKKYQIKNKKEIAEQDRRYYLTHPEVNKRKTKKYREAHKEKIKLYKQSRKSLMRGGGTLNVKTIQEIYEDNIKKHGTLTCIYCLKPIIFGQDTLEHKQPLSRGGKNHYNNLGIACRKCNCSKGNKTESEFMTLLKDV